MLIFNVNDPFSSNQLYAKLTDKRANNKKPPKYLYIRIIPFQIKINYLRESIIQECLSHTTNIVLESHSARLHYKHPRQNVLIDS